MGLRASWIILLALGAGCATAGATSHRPDAPALAGSGQPVDRRAAAVCAAFSDPAEASALLAPSFVQQVPAAQVEAILGDYHRRLGPCADVRRTEGEGHSARYDLHFADGFTAPLAVSVDPESPHRIVGLWLGHPVKAHGSLDAVVAELRQLPGRVSFLVADLGPGGLADRVAIDADRQLAIGSAFKLYVLAELVRAVEAGERRWDEVVRLEPEAVSLPSGLLQDWPPGAPTTLQTLATLMISRSDNTATDQLVRVLGRERIEAMLAATGHAEPARNQPFLTTRELFLLKGAAGDRYLPAKADERRAFLAQVVPLLSLEEDAPTLVEPTRIEELEWFASARDLGRALDWLRRHAPEAGPLRGILTVNPGVDAARKGRRWVGFKGGSEPGVLNLSFVLEDERGGWQVVVATWNDPAANLDEGRFVGLVERALGLLASPRGAPGPAEAL